MKKLIFILVLFAAISCSVSEQHYLSKGGEKKQITGKIKYSCKKAIWIDSVKIYNYTGKYSIGDTLTVQYITYKNQNEFIK